MAKPSLDEAQVAVLLRLKAAGATTKALAAAFQRSESLVRGIVTGKLYRRQPCKGCTAPIDGQHRTGFCSECVKQRCCHCEGPKSPHRASPRCAACDRAKWDRHLTDREPRCKECGVLFPETRRDVLCADCRKEETAIFAAFKQKRKAKLACSDCQGPLPTAKSWIVNRCRKCHGEHQARRRSLSRRQCGICGRVLKAAEVGLCRECRAIDRRITRIAAGQQKAGMRDEG